MGKIIKKYDVGNMSIDSNGCVIYINGYNIAYGYENIVIEKTDDGYIITGDKLLCRTDLFTNYDEEVVKSVRKEYVYKTKKYIFFGPDQKYVKGISVLKKTEPYKITCKNYTLVE